jgi:hypothetical protein
MGRLKLGPSWTLEDSGEGFGSGRMNFRVLSSRTWPRPEVEEERHKDELRFRSSLFHEQCYRRFSYISRCLYSAPVKEAAPSPYIGERVAYRGRNPNGIFEQTNYFTKLL